MQGSGTADIFADRDFAAGSLIVESYGDNPNNMYLRYFGFVPLRNMYMYVCICTYIDTYLYIYVYRHIHIYIHIYIYIYIYAHAHTHMYIRT